MAINLLLCLTYKFFIMLVINKFMINVQIIIYLFINYEQSFAKHYGYQLIKNQWKIDVNF